MHNIKQFDTHEGRTMGWHGLTDVNPELSLQNTKLNSWDYRPERLLLPDGSKTPFFLLTVSDVGEYVDQETGEKHDRLYIGSSYSADSFKPVTNAKLIEILTNATKGIDGIVLASCGTIRNRGRQFFSFELLGEKFSAAGREFTPFLNIGNGNDKSSPLWLNTSNTCTVCDNTFTMNMLNDGLIMEVKKTKFSEVKIGDFSRAIKGVLREQKQFAENITRLADMVCTENTARQFLAGFIGKPNTALSTRSKNIIEEMINLYKTGKGNKGENMADLFSGVTDYYTHNSSGGDNNWRQFESSEFGAGKEAKQKVYDALTKQDKREALIAFGDSVLAYTLKAEKEAEAAETTAQAEAEVAS